MRYSEAKKLEYGDKIRLKSTNLLLTVSYVAEATNPDNEKKYVWVHTVEQNENKCNVFCHSEIKAADAVNKMSHKRAMELLNSIVDYEHIARNTKDSIQHLLRMGFTEDELVNDFSHSREDVTDAAKDID